MCQDVRMIFDLETVLAQDCDVAYESFLWPTWLTTGLYLAPSRMASRSCGLKLLTPMLKRMGVKKNYLPMDIVSWGTAAMMCVTACTKVKAEGVDNLLNLKDSVVCMFRYAIGKLTSCDDDV